MDIFVLYSLRFMKDIFKALSTTFASLLIGIAPTPIPYAWHRLRPRRKYETLLS